jgi:MFS family permease
VEAILNAASSEAHASTISALDEKEKRKYVEFLSRISPPGEKNDPTRVLGTPLASGQKLKIQALLQKCITDDAKTKLKSVGGILQQVGAFFGMFFFTVMAARFGRRPSFLITLLLAWGSLLFTFSTFSKPSQIWYLWPILGFCTLAPFGGYAIYFPELFPTRLRTTGTSFCYNVGRYVTAFGVFILGPLAQALHGLTAMPGFRVAAMVMASSYLIGIIALIWAPETVNQPLPEDERQFAH